MMLELGDMLYDATLGHEQRSFAVVYIIFKDAVELDLILLKKDYEAAMMLCQKFPLMQFPFYGIYYVNDASNHSRYLIATYANNHFVELYHNRIEMLFLAKAV